MGKDEGCKPDKNIGGGETPVRKTSQHLSAESTTEHQKSLHPFRVPFTARICYGGSTPACILSSLSGFHRANCFIIAFCVAAGRMRRRPHEQMPSISPANAPKIDFLPFGGFW